MKLIRNTEGRLAQDFREMTGRRIEPFEQETEERCILKHLGWTTEGQIDERYVLKDYVDDKIIFRLP